MHSIVSKVIAKIGRFLTSRPYQRRGPRIVIHNRCTVTTILLLSATLTLVSCAQTGLSGSASMRVEVEVYKGPLSKELPIQRGELVGMVRDASTALQQLKYDIQVTMCRLGCKFSKSSRRRHYVGGLQQQDSFCEESTIGYHIRPLDNPPDKPYRACPIMVNLLEDAKVLQFDVCKFSYLDPTGFQCHEENEQRKELFDEIATGMAERTLTNRTFSDRISVIVDRAITEQVEEKRPRVIRRINDEVKQEISEEFKGAFAELERQQYLEMQRSFSERARIRDKAEEATRLTKEEFALLISKEGDHEKIKQIEAERDLVVRELERDEEMNLRDAQERRHTRLLEIENSIATLNQQIQFKLTARKEEIHDRAAVEIEMERERLRHDVETIRRFTAEARESLMADAVEYAKSDLISGSGEELEAWLEPSENRAKFRVYRLAAEVAQRLRSRAEYWATAHTAVAPENKRVRIEMADFANFTANYGNQISARADALLKQSEWVQGQEVQRGMELARELLASSTFLRDSQPTSYLKLYDWNRAAVVRQGSSAVDRVRMVEQLVKDTYWTTVNTVFATGRGTFTTALIKDDIGNWNLKNYDNAPGELIDAYTQAGFAAIGAATEVVQAAISGGGSAAAGKALDVANKVALGVSSEQTEAVKVRLGTLTEMTTQRMEAIGLRQDELLKKAVSEAKTAKVAEAVAQAALDGAAEEVTASEQGIEALVLRHREKEDARISSENDLGSLVTSRKGSETKYQDLGEEIAALEESQGNDALLVEKKAQRDSIAKTLIETQNREIEQLEVVRGLREEVNEAEARLVDERAAYKKMRLDHLDKRAAFARAASKTEAAVEKIGTIREDALGEINQVIGFHRDMLDALAKEHAQQE